MVSVLDVNMSDGFRDCCLEQCFSEDALGTLCVWSTE